MSFFKKSKIYHKPLPKKTQTTQKKTCWLEWSDEAVALTEMSNGVAHEINNPLTIIAGVTQIIEMKIEIII